MLGPSLCSASSQHSAVSTASAGPIDIQLRDRAQALQMLDRLVRRSVLAKADAVVGHHVNHAGALQRAKGGSPGAHSR